MNKSSSSLGFDVSVSDPSTRTSNNNTAPLSSSVDPTSTTENQQNNNTATSGVTQDVVNLFQRSSHPTAAVFHVLFKLSAILVYFFGSMFGLPFVMVFVIVVILGAFDFWVVKNVTGRLMVGLRWWNDVGQDGLTTWRYESVDDPSTITRADHAIFWYSMYVSGLTWIIFSFLTITHPQWLVLCGVSLILIWSNITGYWNCSKERDRIKAGMESVVSNGAVTYLMSRGSTLFGGSRGAQSAVVGVDGGSVV